MRTSCLINNFNYRLFVTEAVDSALAQSVPFDEIILVDDGSTDGSLDVLRQAYGGNERVQIISKPNEGQLSCFNAAFAASSGEIICFLDADDLYEPTYLQTLMDVYEKHPDYDCVFTSCRQFGEVEDTPKPGARDRDFGYSVIVTLCLKKWIGASTSCLSLRRSLLKRILPIPYLDDWVSRADDCLVFGSSLAGGRKFHLAQPLVKYRIHTGNSFFGKRVDRLSKYRRKLAVNRLFSYVLRKNGLDPERLPEDAHREFHTLHQPTWAQFREYASIPFRGRVRLTRRCAIVASMLGYYLLGTEY